MKKVLTFSGFLILGIIIGFAISVLVQKTGGKLKFSWNPLMLDLDFSETPHQVPINFGSSPSERSLASALKIIQDSTNKKGPARIYLADDIHQLPALKKIIIPPAGTQLSLKILKQLIASADATDELQICLIPDGGYRVCAK